MFSAKQPLDEDPRTRLLFAVFLGAVAAVVAVTVVPRITKSSPPDQSRKQKEIPAGLRPIGPLDTGPLGQARKYNANKEYRKAEDLCRLILKDDPGNREAKRLLAAALFHQDKIAESADVIARISQDGPVPLAAPTPRPIEVRSNHLLERAWLHRQRREYGQAEAIYRSILENDPGNVQVRRLLAAALSEESMDLLNGIADAGVR